MPRNRRRPRLMPLYGVWPSLGAEGPYRQDSWQAHIATAANDVRTGQQQLDTDDECEAQLELFSLDSSRRGSSRMEAWKRKFLPVTTLTPKDEYL